MIDTPWPDQSAREIAVASIRRHSMNPEEWVSTSIAILRSELESLVLLHDLELPLASAFISAQSWYAFTTRRIVACHAGTVREIDPRYGIESRFGNFKGLGGIPLEICTVRSISTGDFMDYEYETGKASMVPIYACMFWERTKRFRISAKPG